LRISNFPTHHFSICLLISAAAHGLIALFIFAGQPPITKASRRSFPKPVMVDFMDLEVKPASLDKSGQSAPGEPKEEAQRPQEPQPAIKVSPESGHETEAQDGLSIARTILSKAIFAGPDGPALLARIKETDAEERLVQLCNTETLEQVSSRFPERPADYVVPYAKGPVEVSDSVVEALYAAIRFGNRWHWLKYRCEVDPTELRVLAYAFWVGDIIPDSEKVTLPLPYD